MTELKVLQVVFLRLGRAEGHDLLGIIDRDDFAAPARQQLAQQTLARTEVRHYQGRKNSQQQAPKRFPGPARTVNPVEPPRDLVEIDLCLLAAAVKDSLQVDLIARLFGQFPRAANGQLDEFRSEEHTSELQ